MKGRTPPANAPDSGTLELLTMQAAPRPSSPFLRPLQRSRISLKYTSIPHEDFKDAHPWTLHRLCVPFVALFHSRAQFLQSADAQRPRLPLIVLVGQRLLHVLDRGDAQSDPSSAAPDFFVRADAELYNVGRDVGREGSRGERAAYASL